jgi:Ala-tRNA(Pro) deacylase
MATRRITEFLNGNAIKYVLITHSPAFTAQEVAASVHVPGKSFAKTIIARIDGELAMVVVPATRHVDTELLRNVTGATHVEIADESEFVNRFEGCQLGAMPPFGNLFGIPTFVERGLAKRESIAFNAGSHTDVIIMRFADYRRVVHPKLVRVATPPVAAIA